MERKLTKVVDGTEITTSEKMCSCGTDVADNLCSPGCPDTCGDGSFDVTKRKIIVWNRLINFSNEYY